MGRHPGVRETCTEAVIAMCDRSPNLYLGEKDTVAAIR
jgi:hypothetical protein